MAMRKEEHLQRVKYVEQCHEGLNSINFAEVDVELEGLRARLLQAIQGLYLLRNSPVFFKDSFAKFKKEYNKFRTLINKNIFHDLE